MVQQCAECGVRYDDGSCLTYCPHERFITVADARRKERAFQLLGRRVRFAGAAPDQPIHEVWAVNAVGFVSLRGLTEEHDPRTLVEVDP